MPGVKLDAMRKLLALVIVVIVASVIIGLATLNIYTVRNDGSGEVLWNGNEAYLFMNTYRRGVRVSYLEYPWMVVKEWLGAIHPPDDQLSFVVVIHITPSTVQRHVVVVPDNTPGAMPALYTPMQEKIYANYPALDGLCRWADDHFERATEDERSKLGGSDNPTPLDINNVGGWSKRQTGSARAMSLRSNWQADSHS
jgi:hypothetical protein